MATTIAFDRTHAGGDARAILHLLGSEICSMDVGGLGRGCKHGGLRALTGVLLPGVSVLRNEGVGDFSATRNRGHILGDAARNFIVSMPLLQRTVGHQAGTMTSCEPGTFRLLSTALPFHCDGSAPSPDGSRAELIARIPGAPLRQLVPDIDACSNLPIAIRPGAGRIMKSLLELALLEGGAASDAQGSDLSDAIVRAVATAVMESPEWAAGREKCQLSSLARLAQEAQDFIRRNLADPRLGAKLVAAHCGVSERYLHKAFAESVGVGAWIRESRLQECRRAIRNPALRTRSIAEIARDWGFADPASFNKIYKLRFGTTAGRDRAATDATNPA